MSESKRAELGQIVIRPPAGMRERIRAAADANNRSMNAEIVATLEKAYPEPAELTLPWSEFYRMMDHAASAGSDEEQATRIAEANAELRARGQNVVLAASSTERDSSGRLEVYFKPDGSGSKAR